MNYDIMGICNMDAAKWEYGNMHSAGEMEGAIFANALVALPFPEWRPLCFPLILPDRVIL